jgi:CheY-like chemotaxis protein
MAPVAAPLAAGIGTGVGRAVALAREDTRAACGARISIRTPRRNRLEALADLCTGMGFQVSPVQPAADAAICVVDGWEHLPPAGSEPSSPHPVILLLDWPRPSDLEQAEQRGITAVLGQPLLAADLLAAIEVLLPADTQAQAA